MEERNILILDSNKRFTADVESHCFLEEIENPQLDFAADFEEACRKSDSKNYDEVVVAGNCLENVRPDSFNAPVSSYARSAEEVAASEDLGIPCYGVVKNSGQLIDLIDKGVKVKITPRNEEKEDPKPQEQDGRGAHGRERDSSRSDNTRDNDYDDEYKDKNHPSDRERDDRNSDYENRGHDSDRYGHENPDREPDRRDYDKYRDDERGRHDDENGYRDRYDGQYDRDRSSDRRADRNEYGNDRYNDDRPHAHRDAGDRSFKDTEEESNPSDVRERIRRERDRAREEARRKEEDADRYEVDKDMGNIQSPARTIAVYSAKGGVGKTTIACELASFLALSAHGRGRLKVCLADFNVDFGDVLNTLSLDPKQFGMTNWAEDIRARLADLPGDHRKGYSDRELLNIQYKEGEIFDYLQKVEESGLYVLIAPVTNEDSMDLMEDGEEVKVILNNLINNGGFDYVICDTGNNTRNSTFIPLEMSDEIVMVMTQSVNTANCNMGFLSTVSMIGFDTSKVKIVINKARPAKSVGIPVEELQEVMVDPASGRQMECLCVIKDSDDVKAAENAGKPLVYDPSNPFTKSIAAIARDVNEEVFTLEKPEKKKRRLFGRRKEKQ